ncbi:unnamed protein product [Oncorhynchus mykiss]|uniref:Neurotransmitter-gated ion-channel transmembrane domain-containing protein n=1 Tax=Oncorhynchus mykiss TaxID=8022 RepID=A0A060VUN1_ONCMY|nr:unnamed protein product [Oncorhynchus mykiss]
MQSTYFLKEYIWTKRKCLYFLYFTLASLLINLFPRLLGIFMSTCNVDVRWFPFDIQKCEMKFGSWTYDGWLMDLQMNEADISGYMSNGEWDLVGVPGTRSEVFYDCCKEPYPDVTFVVTIRRRTLYYALNLLIPCVLLSSMTLLIFLLPADSGEKISLGITVLLSLTVFMLLVAEIMPATSDSIPLIGQYFASTMIIVGMSVIATTVVLQYHHHDPNGGQMPKWVNVVLLQWVAWFLRMKRPGETPRAVASLTLQTPHSTNSTPRTWSLSRLAPSTWVIPIFTPSPAPTTMETCSTLASRIWTTPHCSQITSRITASRPGLLDTQQGV